MRAGAKIPEPYRLADRAAKRLAEKTRQRVEESKRKLSLMDFDEVNALKETVRLYRQLSMDCKKEWEQLYRDRYTEMWLYLKGKKPDEDVIDELVAMEFAQLLYAPHPVTRYVFDSEVIRKRDRVWEDMEASPTKTQKQIALDKGARFWVQMTGWYTDFTSQDAEIKAYENAGIKKLRRREMNDEKVCQTCRELDGKVYEIKKIPPLEHLRCRRWFEPVKRSEP